MDHICEKEREGGGGAPGVPPHDPPMDRVHRRSKVSLDIENKDFKKENDGRLILQNE